MTVSELKERLKDYPDYYEIKIECPQVHGTKPKDYVDIFCDNSDLYMIFYLDKDTTCCGY